MRIPDRSRRGVAQLRLLAPIRSALGDGLLRTAVDCFLRRVLQLRRNVRQVRLGVSIVGQLEHFGTQRHADSVSAATLIVDGDFHWENVALIDEPGFHSGSPTSTCPVAAY